jgi:hypothetical protein
MQFRSWISVLDKRVDGHMMESDFDDPFITTLNCKCVVEIIITIIITTTTTSNLSTDSMLNLSNFHSNVRTVAMFAMVDLQTICHTGT